VAEVAAAEAEVAACQLAVTEAAIITEMQKEKLKDKRKRAAQRKKEKKREERLVAEAATAEAAAEAEEAAARAATKCKCAQCGVGLLGADFFDRWDYKYCTTQCMRAHNATSPNLDP